MECVSVTQYDLNAFLKHIRITITKWANNCYYRSIAVEVEPTRIREC